MLALVATLGLAACNDKEKTEVKSTTVETPAVVVTPSTTETKTDTTVVTPATPAASASMPGASEAKSTTETTVIEKK